jgi:hypothetical protein
MPRRPRSWANSSLLWLCSYWSAWTNLHRLGLPNTCLLEALGWDRVTDEMRREQPWTLKSFWHHPLYFITDSPYNIYRVASERLRRPRLGESGGSMGRPRAGPSTLRGSEQPSAWGGEQATCIGGCVLYYCWCIIMLRSAHHEAEHRLAGHHKRAGPNPPR